jgi:hypothetical protein
MREWDFDSVALPVPVRGLPALVRIPLGTKTTKTA